MHSTEIEYDRKAVEDHTEDPKRGDIYIELIDFCENEMNFHKKSRDSVKHVFLYGKPQAAKAYVKAKVLEAHKSMGHKVDPTALLLAKLDVRSHAQ